MIPAPMMFSEWAIWNWCAIKAPEEIPDTEIASLSMFNPLAKSVNGGGVVCAGANANTNTKNAVTDRSRCTSLKFFGTIDLSYFGWQDGSPRDGFASEAAGCPPPCGKGQNPSFEIRDLAWFGTLRLPKEEPVRGTNPKHEVRISRSLSIWQYQIIQDWLSRSILVLFGVSWRCLSGRRVGLRRVRRCLCSSEPGRCWARAIH